MPATQPLRTLRLPDGTALRVRPAAPEDAPALARAYARLSEDARRRRFPASTGALGEDDLRRLAEVDHRREEALLACDDDGEVIAEARYVRVPGEPEAAEVAAFVVDAHQRRGIGTALVGELRGLALERGLRRFVAVVAPDNEVGLAALERQGARRRGSRAGEVELEVDLAGPGARPLRFARRCPERLVRGIAAVANRCGLVGALTRALASWAGGRPRRRRP